MFCRNCGKMITMESSQCPYCGIDIKEAMFCSAMSENIKSEDTKIPQETIHEKNSPVSLVQSHKSIEESRRNGVEIMDLKRTIVKVGVILLTMQVLFFGVQMKRMSKLQNNINEIQENSNTLKTAIGNLQTDLNGAKDQAIESNTEGVDSSNVEDIQSLKNQIDELQTSINNLSEKIERVFFENEEQTDDQIDIVMPDDVENNYEDQNN